jgi:hypothetical protein
MTDARRVRRPRLWAVGAAAALAFVVVLALGRTFVLITGAPILVLFLRRMIARRPARRTVQAADA